MATETPHYRLKKPGQDEFYNVADANGNMDILDGILTAKADLDPGTGKVKPEQLPPIDVADQIATHDASDNPHANMNFLRYAEGEPVPPLPENADTLEHKTLAQIQEEFRGAFSGALAPKAHAASHKTGGADALGAGDIGAAGTPLKLVVSVPVGSWALTAGCYQQTVAAAGLLAADDLQNARIEPVGNVSDPAAQKLTDEAYGLLAGPGGYAGCTVNGQLFLRCPKDGAKPAVTFQVAICIVR